MLSTYKTFLKGYTQDPRTAPLEIQQRYLFDAGSLPGQPYYLVARVAASVPVGAFVYMTGSDWQTVVLNNVTTIEDGVVCSICNPAVAGAGVPIGIVESKPGDTVAIVRLLNPSTDIAVGGAVATALYVVGTDGFPAKSGDSNYPTTVAPYVVGVGLGGGKMLLVSGSQALLTGGVAASFVNVLPSTAIAVAGPAAFDKSQTLAAGAMNALGRRVDIEVDFTLTASGASTHTGELDLALGGSFTLQLATFSKSFGGAGTAVYKIRATVITQTTGALGLARWTAEVTQSGSASVLTFVSSATPYSAGIDLTQAPVISALGGASAGSITMQNLLVTVR